jgi:subtilase family serine protease
MALMAWACLVATTANAWTDTATQVLPLQAASLIGDAGTQPLHLAVSLAIQHQDELKGLLTSIQTPGNPAYRSMLTPAQFAASYSPTAAQAQSVVDFLTAAGFTNIVVAPNRLVISADGTAAMAESAFNTPISRFTLDGKTVYSNTQTAQVPDALGGLVTAVLGLQNINHRRASPVHPTAALGPLATGGTTQALDIKDFPIAYDAQYTPNAVTYAIFMYGDVRGVVGDLKTAETNNGLSHATVNMILADGVQGTDTSGADEWDLDSQSSRGIAGGAPTEIWYVSSDGSDASILETYNKWVTDDLAKGASASFGDCELAAKSSGEETSNDPVFMEAAAQGQTLFSSSGDTGAGCSAIVPNGVPDGGLPEQSYPGISPYALEVGATTLTTNADFTYVSEKTWTESGGGNSLTEPEPAWQVPAVSTISTTTGMKASSDISMTGNPSSGANVVVSGTVETVGGTSLSSPLVVGVWARLEATYGNALGFAGPVLYGLVDKGLANKTYGPAITGLNDPTTGTNGLYAAKAGWDYPTGVGTFDICMTATMLGSAGGPNFCLPLPVAVLAVSANSATTTQALTFDGSASTASTSTATLTSYVFDFGDGSTAVTSTTPTTSYTYSKAGTYTASLKVTDSTKQTSVDVTQQVITVSAAPSAPALSAPTAGLSASPASGSAPLTVSFNGASSTTPNSGATITSYNFNFGDGSVSVTQASSSISHTYTAAGSYTASLTVTDSDGQTSVNSAQQAVIVASVTVPPATGIVTPAAPATPDESRLGSGGAMGFPVLMALAGLAGLRRRRAAATSPDNRSFASGRRLGTLRLTKPFD